MNFNADYDASSNNSTNDNKVNAKRARSAVRQIKRLIKCVLRRKDASTYRKNPQPCYYLDEDEIEDNIANEILENEIFEEIDACEDFSGVPVYEDGEMDVLPVCRGQRYIPVHFARTEAGTFFWTSVCGPDADVQSLGDKNAICNYQTAELQTPCDRWAQA